MDSDDEEAEAGGFSFVVDPELSDFTDYNVSHLPPDPSAYLFECGEALREALGRCDTIESVMDQDVSRLAAAIDRLWKVSPDPVPIVSENAARYLRGAVSKRFVNVVLHHRPGQVLNVLVVNPTLSIVDRLRSASIERNLSVNMSYVSDVSLDIGNPRLKEKEALQRKFNVIMICHGSIALGDGDFTKWKRALAVDGVLSVLAVNRAAAGNCYDVSIRDYGAMYNFGFYGRDYVEKVFSLDFVKQRAADEGLRTTCYDHNGLSMIANNLPFGGEFSGKIDAWKAYEVLLFSRDPLPVITHAYTPVGEPLDMFLSRPIPMTEPLLVSLQQSRFLVKEKTDGIPLLIKPNCDGVSVFSYQDGSWRCESYPMPAHPLKHPLQVEARSADQVVTLHYIDYFSPGDFLERRQSFQRENHQSWVEKVVDTYREADAQFFNEFIDHTKHEGFVVQPTNTPFIPGRPSCFYLKGVPTVDLTYADALKFSKDSGLDWSSQLKQHWEGVAELSLAGEIVRMRPDKTKSNSFSEFTRVKQQVPYLFGLFALVEVSADLGVLDLDPQIVTEIRTRFKSKRSYDKRTYERSPTETE